LLATAVLARNQSRSLLIAFGLAGALSAPLAWICVRTAGVLGAAIANALTSVVFLVSTATILRYIGRADVRQGAPATAVGNLKLEVS
jgi:hypothetical protein